MQMSMWSADERLRIALYLKPASAKLWKAERERKHTHEKKTLATRPCKFRTFCDTKAMRKQLETSRGEKPDKTGHLTFRPSA